MVLRYWGEQTVRPQDFVSLVDRSESGIRTSALTDAVTRRGWRAVPATPGPNASASWLAGEIEKGRPVIALIEVSPGTYHYVVIVGLTANDVVFHDPAQAPFRVAPINEFNDRWAAANRWTLVVLPRGVSADVRPAVSPTDPNARVPTGSCAALVAQSVTLARAGQHHDAERGLAAAETLCPLRSAAPIELGGIRFLQRCSGVGAPRSLSIPAWRFSRGARCLVSDRPSTP
jgi:hypothetical protein